LSNQIYTSVQFVCLSNHPTDCQSISLLVHLTVSPFVQQSIWPSVSPFLWLVH